LPVAGASVGLGQQRFSSNAIPAENTDASGHFTYQFDPGQQVVLTIQAKGFAPQMKPFAMGQQKQNLTIQLSSAHRITGQVVNASGNPVPGARIYVQSWQGVYGAIRANFQTDGAGHFHWNEAPAEPVTVSVNAQGLRGLGEQVLTPDQDNVIKLGALSHIRGTVTDAETGKPIENIQLVFGTKWNADQPVSWHPGWNFNAVKSGGKFEIADDWSSYPGIAVKIEASGYFPAESRIIKSDEGDVTLDLKMKPGKDLILTVRTPDGKLVAGANAAMALPGQQVYIQNSREIQNNMGLTVTSGADGRIDFPPQTGNFKIAVFADAGYAEADQDALAKSPVVTLSPWGRIEGRMMVGSKPAVGVNVDVSVDVSSWRFVAYDARQPHVFDQLSAKTDDDGKFVVDRVPPGSWTIGRRVALSDNSWTDAAIQSVEVEPGKTVSVQAGGTGRAVVGKVVLPPELSARSDWAYGNCRITSQWQVSLAGPTVPLLIRMSSAETQQQWWQNWLKTDAGKAYVANQRKAMAHMRSFPFSVNPDGSFRVDDIPAGDYELSINIQQTDNQNDYMRQIAMGYAEFTIPEMPGGRSDEPLQLDPISLVRLAKYKVGETIFDLAMRTPEGKRLKLSDFRGKYVLVDYFHPFDMNIASFKDVYADYGRDGRLALLTINPEFLMKGQNPVRLNNNPWPQAAIVGQGNWAVLNNFGGQNSMGAWLIGPDGKVVAEDLSGGAIKSAVIAALGAPATQPTTAP